MDFKKRPLNQSLIKRFLYRGDERELLCPYRIYSEDIVKTHKYQTESMLKGSYFETLCIERGANSVVTIDLTRKRLTKKQIIENTKLIAQGLPILKGDKTLDQERIDRQAVIFAELCDKYQITVTHGNTQVRIFIPWHKNKDVMLSMEFDIFPTAIITKDGLRLAIIDIKLTTDVNSSFGEFCWGKPEFMDITQALMYLYGVKNLADNIELNPHMKDLLTRPAINLIANNQIDFFYWVFGYKKLDNKLIKVAWDQTREQELHEAINKTVSLIEYYESMGWPTKPNYKLCKDCPVKECIDRQTVQEI